MPAYSRFSFPLFLSLSFSLDLSPSPSFSLSLSLSLSFIFRLQLTWEMIKVILVRANCHCFYEESPLSIDEARENFFFWAWFVVLKLVVRWKRKEKEREREKLHFYHLSRSSGCISSPKSSRFCCRKVILWKSGGEIWGSIFVIQCHKLMLKSLENMAFFRATSEDEKKILLEHLKVLRSKTFLKYTRIKD